MKKIFHILLFFLSFMYCSEVTFEKASSVARNFYNSKNIGLFDLEVVQTIKNNQSNNLMYIFILKPKGFIIVSANDKAMPVLGYSFDSDYNEQNLPVQYNYLLNSFKSDINEMILDNSFASEEVSRKWALYSSPFDNESARSVSPLMSSKWNQDSPWNDLCPEDSQGPGDNVYAGCVAVSMAQIMYYWKYPQVGFNDHSYTHFEHGYQYADFGSTYYDYDNMRDLYATPESQLLLYHAGVAVNMDYSYDGSGASVMGSQGSAYYAMKNYFSYKNSMQRVYPENFSTQNYKTMLIEELNANRPIIYVGCDPDDYGGCHAWNIDGYDDNEYFHCNWGWGGYTDGYFLLSTLGGFTVGQSALVNIEPQSLDLPNILMTASNYYEIDGDGDDRVNPSETVALEVTFENMIPWQDAQNVEAYIEPISNEIEIINEFVTIGDVNSGVSYTTQSPFIVRIPDNNSLGNESFIVHLMATSPSGQDFYSQFNLDLEITLNQSGFPYDSDGTVQSSPLVIDLNQDSIMEIIYGDNNGLIKIVDSSANPVFTNSFPYSTGGQIVGAPSAADIDLDGVMDFVVASQDQKLYAFDSSGLKFIYEADGYLLGTPSIGNLDSDPELEIVVATSISSDNYVYVIDHEGYDNNMDNFPYMIDERIRVGVALADFDNNQIDDIVFGTDDDNLYVLLDSGSIKEGFPFNVGDKIRSAPSVLKHGNDLKIFFGSKDDNFYAINSNGQQLYYFETDGNIYTSPTFVESDFGLGVFFGSTDGYVYGLDVVSGSLLDGWPIQIGNDVVGSVLFEDLNGDSIVEVVSLSNSSMNMNNLDGSPFLQGKIDSDLQITSSSIIADTDLDGDMEILMGNAMGLLSIDIKNPSSSLGSSSNMFRFNNQRTGFYVSSAPAIILGDLNQDSNLDVRDIIILINIILEVDIPESHQFISGDLNSDQAFTVQDIIIIVNTILDFEI